MVRNWDTVRAILLKLEAAEAAHATLTLDQVDGIDPQEVGYQESDLIGLRGGLNTYIYVHAAPTMYADPSGLQSKFFPRKGQLIDKALQDLPDKWCDYWPANCYNDALICLEARCTKTDSCGRKYTYVVDSWIPRNPPRNDPGKDCVCTRWTLNRDE